MSLNIRLMNDGELVYDGNLTHNLGEMAVQATVYLSVWHPHEMGLKRAGQMIAPLEYGLSILRDQPDRMKRFSPKNKWGTYDDLVNFLSLYLWACKKYPDAVIIVSL